MSSARSRGMGLRGLVLGGAVAGLSTLQSCGLLAVGVAAYGLQSNADTQRKIAADRENTMIQADAIRDAGSNRQSVGVDAPKWELFTCTDYADFNNNGLINIDDPHEVINKNKTEFFAGDICKYVFALQNCKGKELTIFGQEVPGEELRLKAKIVIRKDNYLNCITCLLKEPANWHAYVALDGVRIGDYRISVREDPSISLTKK